jgi:hypothetical protein
MTGAVPEVVAAAVRPPVEEYLIAQGTSRRGSAAAPTVWAGGSVRESGVGLGAPSPAAVDWPEYVPVSQPRIRTYLADLLATQDSLAALQSTLETMLLGTAEFEILDAAVPMQLPLDSGSVAWWSQSPIEGEDRFVVPVVIEER